MDSLCKNILKKINSGIIIFDEELLISHWNEWLEQYTGILKDQVIGKNVKEIIPAFKKNYYLQLFQKAFKMGQSMFCSGGLHPVFVYPANTMEGSIIKQNLQIDAIFMGKQKYILIQIFDTTNQFKRVETLKMEIANRKDVEQLLFAKKEQFKTTLLSVGDGVISTDKRGHVQIINRVAEELTGWTRAEAVGKPIETVFNAINEFTRKKCDYSFNALVSSDYSTDTIDTIDSVILISRNNTEIMIEDSVSPIRDRLGHINGMVLVFRDVTEKKQRQDEIKYLSLHDQLTGLYNRRFFEEELKRLDTRRNWPLTIILGDINGLKLINDSFGHGMGDELIKKSVEAIKNGCREDEIICRIGGDEFIILLPKTDASKAEKIVSRIQNIASQKKVGNLNVSISFGIDTKIDETDSMKAVIKKADEQMYHHKLFESPDMRSKTVNAIIKNLYIKDQREEEHSKGVAKLCQNIGAVLGLPENKIDELKTAGLLHDIGKIAIDETIFNKPGKLTEDEWKEIIRHSEIGYRILSTVKELSDIAEYVLDHHEKWNGEGYPKGLKGEEIPFESRILNIADAYNAMISDRSYRNALSKKEALEEIRKNAGIQFDPNLVNAFVETIVFMATAK
ncbi:diguanylate cyclase [Acetobacterium paludosum]|uniref:Diguanylate cyclase n=1 Tax=Acetobacterium paludosum TaxID=52693 RepID=A0A923KQ67_9FIRM|nr:HD domain-containing phosphohydrolase [Acetobacterium paludosum]MBC3888844.1 diguanylate cyclase [Acetobacterium paludosum]